jgi:hypothetical protein
MKSIFLTTGFLFVMTLSSYSQEIISSKNDDIKSRKLSSVFFSFDSKYTSVQGSNVLFYGGTFGIVLNQHSKIGLGGYSTGNKMMFEYQNPAEDNKAYQLNNEIEYFGLVYEYILLPDSKVHITIPVLLAGGIATIKQEVPLNPLSFPSSHGVERTYRATVEKNSLAVIEPGINLELKVFSWMSLDLGASYRFVLGSELYSIPNSNQKFSGSSFHTGLRFYCF